MKNNNLIYYSAFVLAAIANIIWVLTMVSMHNEIECSGATRISSVLIIILILTAALFFWKKPPMQKPWKVVIPIIVFLISLIIAFIAIILTIGICSRFIGEGEKLIIYPYADNDSNISLHIELKEDDITESIPEKLVIYLK